MADMYKRRFIPMNSPSGANGRCLIERMQNGSARITLQMKGLPKKPLELVLFDTEHFYRYPKTLYPDRNSVLFMRSSIRELPLKDICCAVLLDGHTPEAAGFSGRPIDWHGILFDDAPKPRPRDAEPVMAQQDENTAEESFKQQVKELVSELDANLKPVPETPRSDKNIPDDIEWREITPKQLAENRRLWKYAKNPFVISCFDRGKSLRIAENDKYYYLAVPCEKAERLNGCSQGFRYFDSDYCIMKCEK